jgi:autophagy-related protein 13
MNSRLDWLILRLGTSFLDLVDFRAFDISVMYRLDTDFRVTDSEALLSSQFLHFDSSQNSLPESTSSSSPRPRPYLGLDQSQAYGSLSSFHTLPQPGHQMSSSPLTTLRNAPYMGTGPSTPPGQITTPYAHNRSPSQTSLSRFKETGSLPRRPSVTFMQPFKAPSLSSSPSNDLPASPRPGSTRSASAVGRPSSLKESFIPYTEDDAPPSPSLESERKRYSSSFSARRERRDSFHSGRESRLSTDITRRRFSGMSISSRPEEEGSVSSGSLRGEEEEDVGLFLRMVESRKELKSTGSKQSDLDKFRGLRDGYGALSDSVSGSIYIPRISPPATARSVGSGESPHTPVVRSRLSEGVSFMEENARATGRQASPQPHPSDDHTLKPPLSEGIPGGAKPLDIPNSPSMRSWGGLGQRATSFTDHRRRQQDQEISHQLLEDEIETARRHSSSLGSIEGIPPPGLHRRKSSNESAPRGRGRPPSLRGSSSRGTPRGSIVGEGQGSLREKFYSTFAGEEGDEGDELLFTMSDMMGDKR